MSLISKLTGKKKASRSNLRPELVSYDFHESESASKRARGEGLTIVDRLGSSSIAEGTRLKIRQRYKDKCIICGHSPCEAWFLRNTGINHSFKKNDLDNLILLCVNHHGSYDHHIWTMCPCMLDLDYLIQFEERDFAQRQKSLAERKVWTPRSLPDQNDLSGTFNYLFLKSSSGRASRVGAFNESSSDFLDQDAPDDDACFPQVVSYSFDASRQHATPILVQMLLSPFRIEVSLHERTRSFINPWATMCHALEALNTAFVPPTVVVFPSIESNAQYVNAEIPRFEERLLRLRSLYSRILPFAPHGDRTSSETIRPTPSSISTQLFPGIPSNPFSNRERGADRRTTSGASVSVFPPPAGWPSQMPANYQTGVVPNYATPVFPSYPSGAPQQRSVFPSTPMGGSTQGYPTTAGSTSGSSYYLPATPQGYASGVASSSAAGPFYQPPAGSSLAGTSGQPSGTWIHQAQYPGGGSAGGSSRRYDSSGPAGPSSSGRHRG
ncbi:hypothetical protein A0H81_00103 [Grifola frondosa]|uniref:Uncharacterized protein n=1 Tax=Grifola frondosa TaxID=5627 RepID=A0A1C7MSY9_GRIFR|nr:hypothetical protein A0H81_00103 [Grifola frondosa]